MQKRRAVALFMAAMALLLTACARDATTPPSGRLTPQYHFFIPFAPDLPESEYLALCKVGPPATYSFHAEVIAGVDPVNGPRTTYTTQYWGKGNPILATDTDKDGKADFSITVGPTDSITVGGVRTQGACLEGAGEAHEDVAVVGGNPVVVSIQEVNLPAGIEFVKGDVYTTNNPPTLWSTDPAGYIAALTHTSGPNPAIGVISGTTSAGSNVIIYNQLIPPPPPPSLEIIKTADAASVPAGSPIGFSMTVTSSGPGTAQNVVLNDPLPSGAGLSWSISPAVAGCSISANTLSCSLGNMAPGASASVHVTSGTTGAACSSYNNTATVSADNHPAIGASATTSVVCPSVCSAVAAVPSLGSVTNWLFIFSNGTTDANWQGATKGFSGNVAVYGGAHFRTSGGVPYAGTIYTDGSTLGAWQNIVNQNAGQAFAALNAAATVNPLFTSLNQAFAAINALAPNAPAGFNGTPQSLNGLNTQDGVAQTFVLNLTSGFNVSTKINITGDDGDVFILRWDSDALFANGYQGTVKFQSGGAVVPLGGLTAANFINVAGNIASSGGGSNPALPYPQGPGIPNGASWNGGGFFTGYWLTTGDAVTHETSSLSNAIFVGGWYSTTTKFSMTSGTSGVHVDCIP